MRAPDTAPRWIVAIALVAVIVGIGFRATNATHKIFYQDEAVTSLRVAGFGLDDLGPLFDRRPHTFGDIDRLVTVTPAKTIRDTMDSLIREDPQHPPFFYVLEAAYGRIAGAGPLAMRSLAVTVSLLALPLVYALARELFRRRTTAWIALAIYALSPFFVLYAYQAREYGLLPATIVLASLLYLRARRQSGVWPWVAYAASVTLGCYTYPFFAFAIVAHGVAALVDVRRAPRAFAAFFVSAGAGAIAFIPWLRVLADHQSTAAGDVAWATSTYPLAFMAAKWAFFAVATIFDLEFADLHFAVVALAVGVLIAIAVVHLVRRERRDVAVFIGALGLTGFVALVIPDLLLHHRFSTIARYLVPTWLAVLLTVAALLGARAGSRLTTVALPLVLVVAALSDFTSSRAGSWWENNGTKAVPAAARFLQAHPGTVVVGIKDIAPLLGLTFAVPARLRWIGYEGLGMPPLPTGGTTYLYSPSEAVRDRISREGRLRLELAYDSHDASNLSTFRRSVDAGRGHGAAGGPSLGGDDWGEIVLWRVEPR